MKSVAVNSFNASGLATAHKRIISFAVNVHNLEIPSRHENRFLSDQYRVVQEQAFNMSVGINVVLSDAKEFDNQTLKAAVLGLKSERERRKSGSPKKLFKRKLAEPDYMTEKSVVNYLSLQEFSKRFKYNAFSLSNIQIEDTQQTANICIYLRTLKMTVETFIQHLDRRIEFERASAPGVIH